MLGTDFFSFFAHLLAVKCRLLSTLSMSGMGDPLYSVGVILPVVCDWSGLQKHLCRVTDWSVVVFLLLLCTLVVIAGSAGPIRLDKVSGG